MRCALALAGIAVLVVVVSPATAQVPVQDSVVGGASFNSAGPPAFVISFNFTAQSGPSGENPTGTALWNVRSQFGDFGGGGPVTCLDVEGSAAIIATFVSGRATFFMVRDGGTGPDSVGFGALDAASAPNACSIFLGLPYDQFFEPRAMTNSGIDIQDASPLPTSKDRCENGGWRDYGVFKNQGDCVSFITTEGKDPPGRA